MVQWMFEFETVHQRYRWYRDTSLNWLFLGSGTAQLSGSLVEHVYLICHLHSLTTNISPEKWCLEDDPFPLFKWDPFFRGRKSWVFFRWEKISIFPSLIGDMLPKFATLNQPGSLSKLWDQLTNRCLRKRTAFLGPKMMEKGTPFKNGNFWYLCWIFEDAFPIENGDWYGLIVNCYVSLPKGQIIDLTVNSSVQEEAPGNIVAGLFRGMIHMGPSLFSGIIS